MLHHVVSNIQSLTLFITHYQALARISEQFQGELKNVHMRFTEQEKEKGDMNVTFLYEIGEGVAHRSYGLNVAKLAGLPKSLLDEAGKQSSQMEQQEARRRLGYLSKAAGTLVKDGGHEQLEHLLAGIEQL